MYADALIRPWFERLRRDLPTSGLFDAHTHLGQNDPDGFANTPEELVGALDLAGADTRCVTFAMHEPSGYRSANDVVLEAAGASEGRIVPFCRVDPHGDATAEAARCLDRGALGIKLHPRAEQFRMSDPGAERIMALAHERRVPVLVHAGRGIPALGRDVLELTARYPDAPVILAHAGVSDLAWLWRRLGDHPGVFFDSSWWNPADLLTLFALVPPGRILFASDAPYGTPVSGAVLVLRCALEVGLGHEQLAGVCGAQLDRLLAGRPPADLGPAPGTEAVGHDLLLDRVHSWLVTAVGRVLVGGDGEEAIALARLSCEVGEDAPQAEVCRSVLRLLDRHAAFAEEAARQAEEHGGEGRHFPGLHLILVAAVVARTPSVAVPEHVPPVGHDEPHEVGERVG